MALWIDGYDVEPMESQVGAVGFLVERTDENRGGAVRYLLRDHPPRTNRSHQPRLRGWCGTTNNICVHGCGLARISRIAKNGRVCLTTIPAGTQAEADALETLGYPGIE